MHNWLVAAAANDIGSTNTERFRNSADAKLRQVQATIYRLRSAVRLEYLQWRFFRQQQYHNVHVR